IDILNQSSAYYSFLDTGGAVGEKTIFVEAFADDYSLTISNPGGTAPEIDRLDVKLRYLSDDSGPSGVRNEVYPAEAEQDNLLLPDPYAVDQQAFERYDAPTPVSEDGLVEIGLQGGASMAWY